MKSGQQGANRMETFTQIGNSCKKSKIFFRAMKSILGWPSGTAALKFIEIPTTKGTLTPHPVLWPHDFFSEMYAHRRTDFDKKIRGPATAALQFWRQMRGCSFVDNHPDLPELLWDRIIPIGLHGDGGQFTKQDSIYVCDLEFSYSKFRPYHGHSNYFYGDP